MRNSTFFWTKVFCFCLFLSCKTENVDEPSIDTLKIESEHVKFLNQIDLTVKNNMLVFASREDYEKTLDYLGPLQSIDFMEWDKELNFYSLRSIKTEEELEAIGIYDDLLATLLNPDHLIAIENNIYKIDVLNDRVEVISDTQFKNVKSFSSKSGKISLFSTEDDVLDLIENGQPSIDRGYCSSRKVSRNYNLSGLGIESKIVYQRGGIFKSLIAKIKKNGSGGYISLESTPGAGNFWKNKKTKNKRNIGYYSNGGTKRKYSYRPYNRTRRLKSFKFDMTYTAEFGGSSSAYKLYISCN